MKNILALVSGLVFGIGLALSGMTDTAKVIGFLDIFGDWDPSLAWVMGAALLVSFPAYHFISGRKPWYESVFHLPELKRIDRNLLLGAVLFGMGWGLYGYCPGPALSSLAYGRLEPVIFVLAMTLGMIVADRYQNKRA